MWLSHTSNRPISKNTASGNACCWTAEAGSNRVGKRDSRDDRCYKTRCRSCRSRWCFCNDIATTADGTAYAADTLGGRVARTVEGSDTLQDWVVAENLAGADGLSFGPDGMLYVNSVSSGKLLRVDVASDGTAGSVTELKLSAELKGPDGMRFGDDGVLYVAENAAGRVTAVTIDGDNATISPLSADIYDFPAAVTKVGDTLWVLESKIGKLGGADDPGVFYIYPVSLN